jgi:hypothetical protein
MDKIIIIINFLHLFLVAKGQKATIQLSSITNKDGSIDILYNGDFRGSYFLKLQFSYLQNAAYSDFGHVVRSYRGKLTTLKPLNQINGISFSYSYQFWRGRPLKEYDKNQTYLLPYSAGKSVMVQYVNHINQILDLPVPPNWVSYAFITKNPDTIFSCRKGIVVDVINEFQTDTFKLYKYQSQKNYIVVEHEDGTLARYTGLEKDKFQVKPGEKVFPGTPIGIIGRYDKTPNHFVLHISFYYLDTSNKTVEAGSNNSFGIFYNYITPMFLTNYGIQTLGDNDMYQVLTSNEVVKSEMSKKEIKSHEKLKE